MVFKASDYMALMNAFREMGQESTAKDKEQNIDRIGEVEKKDTNLDCALNNLSDLMDEEIMLLILKKLLTK